jgi:hypothetical protein
MSEGKGRMTMGEVKLDLTDGEGKARTVTLRPTPQAALTLSDASGGLATIINRLGAVDMRAMATVIHVGSGGKSVSMDEAIDLVFYTTPKEVSQKLFDFVSMLGRGGKPSETEPKDGARPLENG